ncbi:MAG: hypothetical protein OXG33_00145 [Chloroflexi bacterium]|nr:hypothetical protein [Chloroflexota bacterium]
MAHDAVWIALGLLIAFAVAWRVVATPGELTIGDREYPFAAELWLRKFLSAWDTSSGSSLINISRTYADAPWGLIVWIFGLSTEVAGKFHWMSWHLLGFLAGYFGARLLVGPKTRAAHPVAARAGLLLAGLFWALNPWILARSEQLHVWVSALMLPLLLGLLVSATRTQMPRARVQRALAASAILAFTISVSPHYMAVGVLAGIGWLVVALVTTPRRRRQIMVTAAVFVSGYLVLAAFILVPYVTATVAGSPTGPAYLETGKRLPVAYPLKSVDNTLSLTGERSGDPILKPSVPGALPGWRLAAMIPAALLLLALCRLPDHRQVLGYAVVFGGVTALLQIATFDDVTRPTYLELMADASFGWVVTEPGKLSGSLALAFLPGIALAPVVFTRDAPRRFPILGGVQTVAIGVGLLVYVLPALNWTLFDESAQNVPVRFPSSFSTAPAELDRRNAAGMSRTFLAILTASRYPEWSDAPVIHHPEHTAITTPIVAHTTLLHARLQDLVRSESPELVAALRRHSVARALVPTGTPAGRALAEQLHETDGLELEFSEGYFEVFRTADPPHPWVYEVNPGGPVELSWRREGMHRLVIDVPPGPEAPREIVVQEFWDPLWVAHLPDHATSLERSAQGSLSVRLAPGAHGRLVLDYALQRALVAGHAVTWTGLIAWAGWTLWPRRPRRSRGRP